MEHIKNIVKVPWLFFVRAVVLSLQARVVRATLVESKCGVVICF
jgi:hypothetical protein